MVTLSKEIKRRIGTVLGAVGLVIVIAGLATGYIDVSLWGLFIAFTGQAIILQEKKRPG